MSTARREWDAGSYHRVSGPMVELALKVLDRLPLTGSETVLDAGCGSGRVTALLAERLPAGKVVAIDADADMVEQARENLARFGERVRVEHVDLLSLDMHDEVDAVFSTATFHWVLDHDLLFRNLAGALRPGGLLAAQCGGAGNIASVLAAANEVAADPRWSRSFSNWERPMRYETDAATADRLTSAGFVDVRCWLEPAPVVPDEPHEFLQTIVLGAHVQRLASEDDRRAFVDEVIRRLPGDPVTLDYVRLNIQARTPR